jgi:hypothetical protein
MSGSLNRRSLFGLAAVAPLALVAAKSAAAVPIKIGDQVTDPEGRKWVVTDDTARVDSGLTLEQWNEQFFHEYVRTLGPNFGVIGGR